jgi:hypothetical protein
MNGARKRDRGFGPDANQRAMLPGGLQAGALTVLPAGDHLLRSRVGSNGCKGVDAAVHASGHCCRRLGWRGVLRRCRTDGESAPVAAVWPVPRALTALRGRLCKIGTQIARYGIASDHPGRFGWRRMEMSGRAARGRVRASLRGVARFSAAWPRLLRARSASKPTSGARCRLVSMRQGARTVGENGSAVRLAEGR